jgi:hypothetical protein
MHHVKAETLARYSENDLSGRKAARIGSHLARCAQCVRLRDDLARVPALLARSEVPPLPEHLAARIHTALMTESARRASAAAPAAAAATGPAANAGPNAGPGPDPDGLVQPGQPGADGARDPALGALRPAPADHRARPRSPRSPRSARTARPGWMSPRLAAAAAAVVVAVGGGSYALVQGLGGGGTSGGGTSAAGSIAVPEPRPGADNAPAAAPGRAAGPVLQYLRGTKKASFTPIATGTDFVRGHLVAQVSTTLAGYLRSASASTRIARPLGTPGSATSAGTPNAPDRIGSFSLTGLAACVSRIAAGNLVLLVDIATYQSNPAAVIVDAATQQGPREVWVVGTGCSASRSDVLKQATLAAGG